MFNPCVDELDECGAASDAAKSLPNYRGGIESAFLCSGIRTCQKVDESLLLFAIRALYSGVSGARVKFGALAPQIQPIVY